MPAPVTHRKSILAWQGWQLSLPGRWDPVKLEGDFSRGMVLLADLQRPRLGVRWQTLKKNADVAKSVERAMRDEVGELATKESCPADPPGEGWQAGRLYIEPEPPGRDVWIGFNRGSGRLFQVIHHVRRRDRVLVDSILPTFADGVTGEWSIFDLSCRVPDSAKLVAPKLNVGDLSLEFEIDRKPLIVRQIAVASVALARQSIGRWLAAQQAAKKKHYRPIEQPQSIEWMIAGQSLEGIRRTMTRRRRHVLLRWKPKSLIGVALHDVARDKLLILEAADEKTLRTVAETVGSL